MQRLLVLMLVISLFAYCQHGAKETISVKVDELTITRIHEAFEKGDFDAQQLVEAYLNRINQHNEKLNALTFINGQAMDVAKALDEEYRRTKVLRPLHGIPLIVKDNINIAGIHTTAGSMALKDYVPDKDAFIIKKLVDAGAIILAKSNMAEWAFSPMHTESSTAGTTRNPYNLKHVPAGSSGGTGAAIAANFGTVGLGTDTGNSIRGPSAHGALVGFRTTLGLISRSAIVPLYLRNDVVGPMCRTVEDAARVMEIMVGYDPDDPITEYSNGKIPDNYTQFLDKDGLMGARIGVLRELSEVDPDPEVTALFEQAIVDLESLGATIVDPVVIPNFSVLRENQWCASFKEDLESFLTTFVRDDDLQTIEDVINIGSKSKWAQQRLERNAANTGRWGKSEIPCLDAFSDELRIAFRQQIEDIMDSLSLDALIYPSWNNKPATINRFEEEYQGDNSQIISPHTGQPAFTIPMGYTSGNLPAGLQFLGRMFDEPILIRLAFAYEQGSHHRKPPEI